MPIFLYTAFKSIWSSYAIGMYFVEKVNLKLLRIKIPKDMLLNPKSMESVLAGLTGSGRTITLYESAVKGAVPDYFSLEIASNEGDVGFYILTPQRSQLLVEKLFYSQFPDIEIIEAEDYTKAVPNTVPDSNWNLWGGKYILEDEQAKPITTYPFFEDKFSGEMIDPLAAIFEIMGSLGPGEHLWFQIQITPADPSWKKQGIAKIEEILKGYNLGPQAEASEDSMMKILPHHELEIIKAINSKIGKTGFNTQIIFAYIARRESYRDIVPGTIGGSMRQFETGNLNNFFLDKYYTTSTYFLASEGRKNYRKRRLLDLLKNREMQGETPVLNTEELATIFHFPTPMAKVPSIPRLESKTAPAPSNLPLGE